jgi:predicted GTPase
MSSEQKQEKLINNVLVLGKTGVGKTSLINYLFGLNLPVGAGLPVTKEGVHEQVVTKENIEYHVYDSWGIEANAMTDWENSVLQEVARRNNSLRIADWFHAIYYCFSANSARVEEAEIKNILLPLLKKGYHVLIVLTHADAGFNKQEKITSMRDVLLKIFAREKLNFNPEDILQVSSVSGQSLAGDKYEQFGKEAIFKASLRNLRHDIAKRLPEFYKSNVLRKLADWRERCLIFIAHADLGLFFTKKNAHDVLKDINLDLNNTFDAANADGARCEREAEAYFAALIRTGVNVPEDSEGKAAETLQLKKYDFSQADFRVSMESLGVMFKTNRAIRKELTDRVEKTYNHICESIQEQQRGYTGSLMEVLGKLFAEFTQSI